MAQLIKSTPEAVKEYNKWRHFLNEQQQSRFLNATLSKDGEEWCILSGPNLTFDRAGFGDTVTDAVKDYLSVYISQVA